VRSLNTALVDADEHFRGGRLGGSVGRALARD